MKLSEVLSKKSYPGRGIMIGRSADGRRGVIAYFIMGRSENSRNRVFTETEDGIKTEAFDPAKLVDPSLIIYSPVRTLDGMCIVTNGDQTDTAYDGMKAGMRFDEALESRRYEPDGPNYTPRISGITYKKDGELCYKISILKSGNGNPDQDRRYTFAYTPALSGQAHFISTYVDDDNPLPSFAGEPIEVSLENEDIDAFASELWDALNADNRVSLYVRYEELETGAVSTKVINRHG